MIETSDGRRANLLYQVLDDSDAHQQWHPESQPLTYLIMTDAERAAIAAAANFNFVDVAGDLVIGTGDNTVGRLAPGANGESGQVTGTGGWNGFCP